MRSKTISTLALLAGTCAASTAMAQPANTDLGALAVPGSLSVANSTPVAAAAVNWYRFSLTSEVSACALTWMDIDTSSADAAPDTEVGLYDSNGLLVGNDDDDGNGNLSSLSFGTGSDVTLTGGTLSNGRDSRTLSAAVSGTMIQVLTPGTYYVAIGKFNMTFGTTAWNVTSTGGAGTVGVTINTGVFTAPTAPASTELGTMATVDTRNVSTTLASGSIAWYHVTVPPISNASGTFFDLDTEGSTLTTTNATRIAVYNKAGRLVTSDTTDGSGTLSQITYGQTTPARPAVGTGLTYNGRDGIFAGCDYYIALAGASGTTGANAFGFTSTSTANNGTALLNLRTGAPSTSPTITGTAGAAQPGGTSHIAATIVAGANPASTGLAVTVDLSSVGGAAGTAMFDDGLHGDGAANDRVYGLDYVVPGATAAGTYTLALAVSDAQARAGSGSASLTVFTPPTTIFDFGDMSVQNCQTQIFDLAAGEIKWFRFNSGVSGISAGVGKFLDIDTEGTACVDTEIGVYRSNGALVTSDDDSGSGALSSLTFGAGTRPAAVSACGTGLAYDGSDGALVPDNYFLAAGMFNVTFNAAAFSVTSTGPAQTGVHLNLCSQPPNTPPTGTGSASTTPELGTATLTVTVTPGGNPVSTGITVTADATSLGGGPGLVLDDAGNGTLGDNIYAATVVTNVAAGTYTVPFVVADAQSRSSNGNINATVIVVPGACCASDSSCSVLGAFACASSGGTYGGAGSNCGGATYAFALNGGGAFEDIAATGTDISAAPGDDSSFNVVLSFPFTFYGNVFNSVNVCTNGFMSFDSTSTIFGNPTIPNTAVPNNVLAVLWDDYNFNQNTTDSLKTETRGTSGVDLRQIFQWTNVAQYSTAVGNVDVEFNTFQCVLFEDGRIEYRYGTISDGSYEQITGNPGATVGVEDGTGSALSVQYGTGNGVVSSNSNLAISPTTVPSPCDPCARADFNSDHDINPDDLGDFITCYFSEPPCAGADFNNDSDVNPDDLGDFITLYFQCAI